MATTSSRPLPSKACTSILDNDLYKLTMQQAVRQHYPNTPCSYRFTNRSPELALPGEAVPWLKEKIRDMALLQLTNEERVFLESKCPYLTKDYLDWLQMEFRFKPEEQVQIDLYYPTKKSTNGETNIGDPGPPTVEISIAGIWDEVILYEVPLLALISEAYFRYGDRDWTYDGQFELAKSKAERMAKVGAKFAEFGTRRRRDYKTHLIVMEGLIAGSPAPSTALPGQGFLTGTSNLHFAHILNITPIGTMAHEWYMGIAAILDDASQANKVALEQWAITYPGQVLGIALTDTFTTDVFLKSFKGNVARDWTGVRHDSGDPFEFMDKIIKHYDQDPLVGPEVRKTKRIVFSDGLDTDLAIRLQEAADTREIQVAFGIGTYFTNHFQSIQHEKSRSPPMNIVIKLHQCAGRECVKLSDDNDKESGSEIAVTKVKQQMATLF
ncbi:nicotinate phosphoribosyltransferase [Entomortierella beljakovae]|nr:nicotinate phosphoribosyltransferase [Entomortierella beljakovae]